MDQLVKKMREADKWKISQETVRAAPFSVSNVTKNDPTSHSYRRCRNSNILRASTLKVMILIVVESCDLFRLQPSSQGLKLAHVIPLDAWQVLIRGGISNIISRNFNQC